jgi:uncharacterized protein (DUF1697 family)
MRYVAFLRGINVGGNHMIKMSDLSQLFTSYGLSNVKTFIASGNVLFDSLKRDEKILTQMIEDNLKQRLNYEVRILLRSINEINEMVERKPFKMVEEMTKKYVTFLFKKPLIHISIPYLSSKDGFEIIEITNREIYTVAYPLPNGRYGNLTFIEKEFGTYSTTRNWNTIERILAL